MQALWLQLYWKRDSDTRAFLQICEISKNTFFYAKAASGDGKFNELFSVAIPSELLLSMPPPLYLPVLPISIRENLYLALQIARRIMLKAFYT